MKILMINGSPRINGSTAKILGIIRNYLEEKEEVNIEYFNLSELEMAFCKGCCSCFKTGKCIINDDCEKLSKIMAKADGIIIGSPTYASNISGHLKVLVDRGHLIIEQLLYKKYTMGIITGENYGASTASKILKSIFSYSGAFVSGMIVEKIPFSNNPSFEDKDKKAYEKKAENFYRDIKAKRNYFFQKFIHSIIFNVGIKPFVLKKGPKYEGVLKGWKENNIISSF